MEPKSEYRRRLEGHEAEYAACERRHIWLGNVKLMVVGVGVVLLWLVLARHVVEAEWLAAPVAAYMVLALGHELVLRRRRAVQVAIELYKRGVARIEDRWPFPALLFSK